MGWACIDGLTFTVTASFMNPQNNKKIMRDWDPSWEYDFLRITRYFDRNFNRQHPIYFSLSCISGITYLHNFFKYN